MQERAGVLRSFGRRERVRPEQKSFDQIARYDSPLLARISAVPFFYKRTISPESIRRNVVVTASPIRSTQIPRSPVRFYLTRN